MILWHRLAHETLRIRDGGRGGGEKGEEKVEEGRRYWRWPSIWPSGPVGEFNTAIDKRRLPLWRNRLLWEAVSFPY